MPGTAFMSDIEAKLLLTRERLQVGEVIRLSLYLSEDMTDVRPAAARVVRSEPRTADRSEVWHHSVAVQFAEPLADCEVEIKDLAERQAALGIPRD
jgi:hypothetical protein